MIWRAERGSIGGAFVRLMPREPADASVLNLPASLLCLLGELRPCFTAPGFATFCGLVAGLAGQVRRRTVVGMLLGGCPAARLAA